MVTRKRMSRSTTYLGIISPFGEADSQIAVFKARNEAEALRKGEAKEVNAIVKLDPPKVKWLKERLKEV